MKVEPSSWPAERSTHAPRSHRATAVQESLAASPKVLLEDRTTTFENVTHISVAFNNSHSEESKASQDTGHNRATPDRKNSVQHVSVAPAVIKWL
ncbi:hypothetical protein E2C01_057452 [Portunus trituberculatus]|uniref:Uncharacterized protein n=1 Tax=Portunus trituberculatus TaxID=210409 RepID=A0A5B7H3D5_PORTR|nr:hypothetical protein [Portunus trituberculatus]